MYLLLLFSLSLVLVESSKYYYSYSSYILNYKYSSDVANEPLSPGQLVLLALMVC